MDQRLQEMLDHYEITKTLKEYCHFCDRCDREHMAGLYVEDSWDDHGIIKCPGPEFAERMTAEILAASTSIQHILGQSLIKVDGDRAGAETYFLAVMRDKGEDGVDRCNQLGGRFVDRLERENGRWRIKHRNVVRDWTMSIPVEREWESALTLTPGRRSNDDPSYEALGLTHSGIPVSAREG